MSKFWKSIIAAILIILIAGLVVLDFYIHNFHSVIPNQIYRSAQLSSAQFATTIKKYDIHSIINLRGSNVGSNWYDNEMTISKIMNVKHYNVALDSDLLPSPDNFQKLVNILQSAPKPILIHCESGVDRSGLAAAVSLILQGDSLQTAASQVSWHYFVFSSDSVGKQFLKRYGKWLKLNNLTTSKQNFLLWLAQY